MYLPEEIENQLNELSGIDKRIIIESQLINNSQLLLSITIDKSLINFQQLQPLDVVRFVLLLKPTYPKIPPLLYCITRFCIPELCDGRDFLEDALQMKWDPESCFLKLIISQIPSFIERYLSYYNNNDGIGDRKMFGKYYLDSIYELTIIKYIPYLYFDVISEVVGNDGTNINLEDRKMVITDNFVLLFCNKSLYELDQLRLIFIGPITSLIHIRQFIKDGIVLLKWMVRGKEIANNNIFQMELRTPDGDYIVDTLIDNLSKRSIQFKVTNKIGSNIKREGSVPMIEINLVEEEIKHLENKINNKEDITKESISVLVNLYEKAIQYYSALNDMRFEVYIKKLHNIYSNNEYTSLLNMKTITRDNNKYNVTQFKRKRKKRTGNEETEGKKKKEKKIKKKNENKESKVPDDKDNENIDKKEDLKEENINNINNDNQQKINEENKIEIKDENKPNLNDNNNEINKNNIINNIINNKKEKKEEEKDDKKEEKENMSKRNVRKREEGSRTFRKNRNDKNENDYIEKVKSQRMYIDKKEIEEMLKSELNTNLLNSKDKENKTETRIENNKETKTNIKEENKNENSKELSKEEEKK